MNTKFNNLKNRISVHLFNKSVKISNYEIYFENLNGKNGLEIGGPSTIFEKNGPIPIYHILGNLDGCNFGENTVWEGKIKSGNTYKYGKRTGYQFICDAVDMSTIPSESYEFILASHVLEHIANPFKALYEWLRVLKDKGIFLLILPHKNSTFDHRRQIITLKHLIEDYEHDIGEDDLSHLPEILELHDLKRDKQAGNFKSFKERSLNNYRNRCLHQHVFDKELAIEIVNYFKIKIISVDMIFPNNIIIFGKKTDNFQKVDNDRFF
jgi:SAM-dependent methyltransferase